MSGNLVQFPTVKYTAVVDSWPVMEWLKGREPATSRFRAILADSKWRHVRLVMSTINLDEVYHNCIYAFGQVPADEIVAELLTLPTEVMHPSQEDTMRAARIKGLYQRAYGDVFAAVLAIDHGARVLSGDPDFLKLQRVKLPEVEWLGK